MQLWLTLDNEPDTAIPPPPAACPDAGCGGDRFRLLQAVAKPVRGATPGSVAASRYVCLQCRRTFRAYPAGIDRGNVPAAAKNLAAALHWLGLSLRDISRTLGVLGIPLGKSRVHTVVAGIPRPAPRKRWMVPLLDRIELSEARDAAPPRAWAWIRRRRHTLRRAIDPQGRLALVVEGIDADLRGEVDLWAREALVGFGVRAEVVWGDADRPRAILPPRPSLLRPA